jgi:hypothetical protein
MQVDGRLAVLGPRLEPGNSSAAVTVAVEVQRELRVGADVARLRARRAALAPSSVPSSMTTVSAPSRIRTCGLLLRRESLYPAELSGLDTGNDNARMNLNRLFRRAKKVVDDRGGTDALKQDAQEVREAMKGPGSFGDKAKAAAKAIKDPGAPGEKAAGEKAAGEHAPGTEAPGTEAPGEAAPPPSRPE